VVNTWEFIVLFSLLLFPFEHFQNKKGKDNSGLSKDVVVALRWAALKCNLERELVEVWAIRRVGHKASTILPSNMKI
jgi:hypothetical protein